MIKIAWRNGVAGYFLRGKAEDAIESAVDPLLKDSIPKIEGNTDITIATASIKKVWDIAPQPAPTSITIIKDSVRKFTDPLGTDIVL